MSFTFAIGNDVTLLFQVAPVAPVPQPAPVSVYSDFAPVFDNVLTGSVSTYEEVNNGD